MNIISSLHNVKSLTLIVFQGDDKTEEKDTYFKESDGGTDQFCMRIKSCKFRYRFLRSCFPKKRFTKLFYFYFNKLVLKKCRTKNTVPKLNGLFQIFLFP